MSGNFYSEEDSFLREALQEVPMPKEQLGGKDGRRYTILEQLGHGGMGQVFLAEDAILRRKVALKFIQAAPGPDMEAVLREGRVGAQLDHENIVRIFNVDEWSRPSGGPRIHFLVMEYLEGESLAALLKRGPLTVRRALEILEAIAVGLEHAHERHLVHRDIKPGNVFLTRQGAVMLLDFGLSHLMTATGEHAPHHPTAGTAAYMAPEQFKGGKLDARTDVWAVGVVLYEMLTGSVPYPPTPCAELRKRVLSKKPVPSVRARIPEIPEDVEELLLKRALTKDPARRFPSAKELRDAVGELLARLFAPGPQGERSAVAPQHRQLTLLYCRLTWCDRQVQRLDPEEVRELDVAFHRGCEDLIGHYGGTIHQRTGGEVLASFGYMQVREEDAERAAQVALHLTQRLPGMIQRKLPRLLLSRLAVQVGLHADMVSVEPHAFQGAAPRIVAWLASQARHGEILVGRMIWKLLNKAFELESRGTRVLEGFLGATCIDLYSLERQREAKVKFDRVLAHGGLSPLVGREHEMEQLLKWWEGARKGQGAFVLLSGEAGIGKSRLLQELYERIPFESATRLRLQCWSLHSASALHPSVALLQALVRFSREGTPPQHLRELRAQLTTMGLPEEHVLLLGLLLSLPIPEGVPVLRLTTEQRREKTHQALAELLLRVAQQHPALVVIEDLHWADSFLLDFLRALLAQVQGARLLVVLSSREVQPDWPAYPWLHQLPVKPLPSEFAAALVRYAARGERLPEESVRELVGKTDGIPLFIEEMTRMVLDQSASGTLKPRGLPHSIPITLHELLLARLDMRPRSQKALAQLGAVVGREFSSTLLAAIMERDVANLQHDFAGLVEAGLFQEEQEGTSGPRYQFRHALFQEAAYRTLTRSERQQHHQRVAQVLAERFPTVAETKPEVLAYHYTEAEQQSQAIPYWSRAGLLALNRRAIPEAVSHLNQALELILGQSESSQNPSEELQVLTALGFAQAQLQGFNSPTAIRIYERVWELLRLVREVPPQLAASFWDIFSYHLERAEFSLCHEVARHVVSQADHQHNQELLVSGNLMMAIVFCHWGRMQLALEYSERAMNHARFSLEQHRKLVLQNPIGSPTHALAYISIIHLLSGRLEQARQHGEQALRLAHQIGEPATLMGVWTFMALACLLRREHLDALRWANEFITRGPSIHSWSQIIRGRVLAELGEPRDGLVRLQREVAGWRKHQLLAGLSYCLCMLAEVHLKLGQTRQGLAVVHDAFKWARETGERIFEAELHRVRGELLRAAGREHESKYDFFRALLISREQGALLFELRATVSLSRLLRDLGRPRAACRLLTRICDQFEADGDSIDLREARTLLEQLS